MTPHSLSSRQQGRLLWPLLILLIVVVLLAAAGWWGWQQWQRMEGQRAVQSEQISTLQQALQQLSQQQRQQNQTQQQALQQLREQQDQMTAMQARDRKALFDVTRGGQRLWLINEAESLASLASQRLLLTGDAQAARRLLQAADKTLARIDDPAVLPARRALAVDMEKLHGAMQVDIQGLVLRLGALQDLVPELTVPARAKPAEQPTEAAPKTVWQRILDHLPVHIHRHDGKLPLPLTDTQASLVRLTLEANLQQAQLALMQSRYRAYQQALASTRQTLHEWFRDDDSRARQMLNALDELGSQQVKQAMPEIGAGLAAIRQLKRDTAKKASSNLPADNNLSADGNPPADNNGTGEKSTDDSNKEGAQP